MALEDGMVVFRNRSAVPIQAKPDVTYPRLDPEAYHFAKQVAPGYDVYALEQDWRDWWVQSGMPELGSPGKAFIAHLPVKT